MQVKSYNVINSPLCALLLQIWHQLQLTLDLHQFELQPFWLHKCPSVEVVDWCWRLLWLFVPTTHAHTHTPPNPKARQGASVGQWPQAWGLVTGRAGSIGLAVWGKRVNIDDRHWRKCDFHLTYCCILLTLCKKKKKNLNYYIINTPLKVAMYYCKYTEYKMYLIFYTATCLLNGVY